MSGQITANSVCLQVYRSVSDPAAVAAEVFRRNLSYIGVHVPSSAIEGEVPESARVIEHAPSKPLHEILWGMNHWSTNVIAEQLVMALGGTDDRLLDSAPLDLRLSRERAVAALQRYAQSLAPKGDSINMADGSGLSHDNRVTPAVLCSVLTSMQADRNLGIEFENSLAVSGRSGTLKERSFGLPAGVLRGKTGTIDGVSSLAGYLVTPRGNKYAFAIIQNSSLPKGDAVRFEDRFVRALYNEGN